MQALRASKAIAPETHCPAAEERSVPRRAPTWYSSLVPSWFPMLLGAGVLFAAPNAPASDSLTVGISFSAPEGCASAQSFMEGTGSRLTDVRLVSDPNADVRVRLTPLDVGVRADLRILLKHGDELERSLEADDCDSAAQAIAFVAAVALDPGSQTPLELRNAEPTPNPLEPQPTDLDSSEQAPPTSVAKRPVASGHGSVIYGEGSVGGLVLWGPAPGPLFGGELAATMGAKRGGWWAPSASVALGFAAGGGFQAEGGTARFQQASALLWLCPTRLAAPRLEARICLTGEAGIVMAQGRDTLDPSQSLRPWLALGAGADLTLRLSQGWGLWVRGAALSPLVRDEYEFEGQIFHRVAAFSVRGAMGVSMRFQ